MNNEYKTIKEAASDEFTEKRSRFIGYIKPVSTEQEAIEFINSIKSKNWNATHNVYAYTLREGQIRRYSDDGEPQGTAGIPVLDVLLKEEIVDCAVVVTRYFGGVLLGTGGLVRAYSHAAKLAVDAGKIVTMSLCSELQIHCDYNFYDKLAHFLSLRDIPVKDTDFGADITVNITIRSALAEEFNKSLEEFSNGRYHAILLGEQFDACE